MRGLIPICIVLVMISFPFLIIESKVRSYSAYFWSAVFSISATVLFIAVIAAMKNI